MKKIYGSILCALAFAGGMSAQSVSSRQLDGALVLNEGWFGHDPGSISLLTPADTFQYNALQKANAGKTLGNTACYGVEYGGKLYFVSKQNHDSGARLTVCDGNTLEILAQVRDLGGAEGRSIVGASPEKMYVGTSRGILPLNASNDVVGDFLPGSVPSGSSRQSIGDMLKAGRLVFAVQQNRGLLVVNPEKDSVVKVFPDEDIQGVAQTRDGNVWFASERSLYCINPSTLALTDSVVLADSLPPIRCMWGAWSPAPFMASLKRNVLYWVGSPSAWSLGTDVYAYEPGTDASEIKKIFSMKGRMGADSAHAQTLYGSPRCNPADGDIYLPAVQSGWGANYKECWILDLNPVLGKIVKQVKMSEYFWFPSQAVFFDRYAPVFAALAPVSFDDSEPLVIDFSNKVADVDNLSSNILLSLKEAGDSSIVKATLNGKLLTLSPLKAGKTRCALQAESNGLVTELDLPVEVMGLTNLPASSVEKWARLDGNSLRLKGFDGCRARLYAVNGKLIESFSVKGEQCLRYENNLPEGLYLLRITSGSKTWTYKLRL